MEERELLLRLSKAKNRLRLSDAMKSLPLGGDSEEAEEFFYLRR